MDRDVAADTRDVPFVERERLVRRELCSHYLVETGGLWQMKLSWNGRAYYEAAAFCSSRCVTAGSTFTPGPMVELVVTVFR